MFVDAVSFQVNVQPMNSRDNSKHQNRFALVLGDGEQVMVLSAKDVYDRSQWMQHLTSSELNGDSTPAAPAPVHEHKVESDYFKYVVYLLRNKKEPLGLHMDSEGQSPTFSVWVDDITPESMLSFCFLPYCQLTALLHRHCCRSTPQNSKRR